MGTPQSMMIRWKLHTNTITKPKTLAMDFQQKTMINNPL
jgi:hypothetical protein